MDLEKQYEKSKPLVNLVDNMVKLGSLYRNGQPELSKDGQTVTLDRYEFNQRMQERKFLQEERKHWDRVSPNHLELKVFQVNYLFSFICHQLMFTIMHPQCYFCINK